MINGQVDIAVHSMKDVPTALPIGIVQAAVLERANTLDILVHKGNLDFLEANRNYRHRKFASSSAMVEQISKSYRSRFAWKRKYQNAKIKENDWNGAVFAAAGLERINLKPKIISISIG